MSYRIGVDIGGTTIKAGLVDEQYHIVYRSVIPTRSQEGADDGERLANGIVKLVEDLCEQAGLKMDDIGGIGIGCPGTIDSENGVVVYSNNIDLHDLPLRKLILEKTGHRIEIGNDADVAAYGEYVAGSAAGCKSVVMITLGTGLGSGFVNNGKIYSGANSRGGEFGHTAIVVDGVRCTCGRKGCWESYASATALIRMTKEAMAENKDSKMWETAEGSLDNVNGKTAFDTMLQGDACAKHVVDVYIKYLAAGLTNIINSLHPERICLGGGVSHSGDDLLIPLREETYRCVYGGSDEKTTQIVLATLGNDAGIIGAAML